MSAKELTVTEGESVLIGTAILLAVALHKKFLPMYLDMASSIHTIMNEYKIDPARLADVAEHFINCSGE